MTTFNTSLSQWLALRSLNTKPKTREFYTAVAKIISNAWTERDVAVDQITPDMILAFAQLVSHHCPSRWNTFVATLSYITPHGKILSRRRLRVGRFDPPSQLLFEKFLADVDSNPRTKAGLTVRFLVLTGLRKGEAFGLRWENVFAGYIKVPAELCKSGVERAVPFLPGLAEIIARLRAMDNGVFVLPRACPRTEC